MYVCICMYIYTHTLTHTYVYIYHMYACFTHLMDLRVTFDSFFATITLNNLAFSVHYPCIGIGSHECQDITHNVHYEVQASSSSIILPKLGSPVPARGTERRLTQNRS